MIYFVNLGVDMIYLKLPLQVLDFIRNNPHFSAFPQTEINLDASMEGRKEGIYSIFI